ncbi:MAG TPA: SIS domain-containing protein [Anaerolineae bacterium]|nr:SIS domain-containing protein [Anaerolineae bacterium]
MKSFAPAYINEVVKRLQRISEEEMDSIYQAAELITDAIENGNRIFGFGCTHSSLPVQDIVYRAGGLMLINPIFAPGLASMDTRPATLSTSIERVNGYAKAILDNQPIQKGDVLILVSVSGRNAMPIEMADEAKKRGLKVIGLTSLAYTSAVSSRHPSGKKMYEFADVVIDGKIDPGDAVLEADGVPQKFCPVSGAINAAILQSVVAATIELLLERGITPPVFLAANVEGGDEYNAKMLEKYKDRIFYM